MQIQRSVERREILRRSRPKRFGPTRPRRVYDAPNKGVLWGWEVSAYVWTKAISAGAFLMVNFLLTFTEVPIQLKMFGNAVALLFLALTGVLLIKDLGRPERFIYTLLATAVEILADAWELHHFGLRSRANRVVGRSFL